MSGVIQLLEEVDIWAVVVMVPVTVTVHPA